MTSPMGLFRDNTKKLQTDVIDKHSVSKSELEGGKPVATVQRYAKKSNLGQMRTIILINSQVESLNPVGSSHFEISAPPTQPQFLLLREIGVLKIRKTFFKMKLLSKGGIVHRTPLYPI